MPDPALPNEMLPILSILLIIIVLLLISTNLVIFLLYRKIGKRFSAKLDTFAETVSEGVSAGAKMLEVRDFYDTASAEYQRLLNEAHRAGDREKQDRYRKLIDRLNALKARTLDQTSRMLEDEGDTQKQSNPRRSRRPRRPRSGRRRSGGGSKDGDGKPQSSGGSKSSSGGKAGSDGGGNAEAKGSGTDAG